MMFYSICRTREFENWTGSTGEATKNQKSSVCFYCEYNRSKVGLIRLLDSTSHMNTCICAFTVNVECSFKVTCVVKRWKRRSPKRMRLNRTPLQRHPRKQQQRRPRNKIRRGPKAGRHVNCSHMQPETERRWHVSVWFLLMVRLPFIFATNVI